MAVTAPATPTPTELTTADVEAFLDGYLPGALNSAKIPGAVVSVVKDGEVVTARGYGYADVEAKTPVTASTEPAPMPMENNASIRLNTSSLPPK